MGQAEGDGAHQSCLSCCPTPGMLTALKEEGHKAARTMNKKLFQCSTCGFGWISPEFLGCVEFSLGWATQLHICPLERHSGHQLFSHREPRQVCNLPLLHSCRQSGTKWEMGGEGASRDLLNSSPGRSKVWAWAPESQHKGRARPPLHSGIRLCWAHSGLCHNTALFIQVTFHRALCSFSSCDPDFC